MVSFSCEACGDVLTKKKLDAHVNRCWNASFTCLDCMQHFQGTAYRAHTSCISEAQKYQGHLYRGDKKSKPTDMIPLKAYVEDGSDVEMDTVAVVQPPPAAPSPPPGPQSGQQTPVNVFDFMTDQSPTRPSMIKGGGSTKAGNAKGTLPRAVIPEGSYTYGDGPVELSMQRFESDPNLLKNMLPPTTPNLANHKNTTNGTSQPGLTPIYEIREPRTAAEKRADGRSSQKRKRQQVEDLDLSLARARNDDPASTPGLHSGLTGGLSRLLSKADQTHPALLPSPVSPAKRTRAERQSRERERERERERDSQRDRERDEANYQRRSRQASSDDDLQSRRRHRHPRSNSPADYRAPAALPSSRKLKAIDYRRSSLEPAESGSGSGSASGAGALALTKTRRQSHGTNLSTAASGSGFARHSHAELFLSLVVKGPDSSKGQSVYTALKGFHGQVGTNGSNGFYNGSSNGGGPGPGSHFDHAEKELLKGLRMKRNKRGEVVLFARSAHDDSS